MELPGTYLQAYFVRKSKIPFLRYFLQIGGVPTLLFLLSLSLQIFNPMYIWGRRFPQRFFFSTFLCLGLLLCFISFLSILFMTLFLFLDTYPKVTERFYTWCSSSALREAWKQGKLKPPHKDATNLVAHVVVLHNIRVTFISQILDW